MAAVQVAPYLFYTLVVCCQEAKSAKLGGVGRLFADGRVVPKTVQRLRIDYRILLLGSLLPDIVDKPLGFWLLPELFNHSTRNIGHTLVFNLSLLVVGLLLLRLTQCSRPLCLGLGSAGHLLLDHMWEQPSKFLWPFYGWSFPAGITTLDEWLSFQLSGRWLLDPLEIVGAMALLWVALQVYRRRAMHRFLKAGAIW